jgi:ferritin
MKLSNELNGALNEQINIEYHNSLIYAQIASYFEDLQLKKIAEYFRNQSQDEKSHADKFIAHINDRTGGSVSIAETPAPISTQGMDISRIAELYISTEESTTESIESLYELANEEKSFIDLPFLLDMVREQVEEEDSAQEFALKATKVCDLVLWDSSF